MTPVDPSRTPNHRNFILETRTFSCAKTHTSTIWQTVVPIGKRASSWVMNEKEENYWANEMSDDFLNGQADEGDRLNEGSYGQVRRAPGYGDLDSPEVVELAETINRLKLRTS
jgi:hypothetical protein